MNAQDAVNFFNNNKVFGRSDWVVFGHSSGIAPQFTGQLFSVKEAIDLAVKLRDWQSELERNGMSAIHDVAADEPDCIDEIEAKVETLAKSNEALLASTIRMNTSLTKTIRDLEEKVNVLKRCGETTDNTVLRHEVALDKLAKAACGGGRIQMVVCPTCHR